MRSIDSPSRAAAGGLIAALAGPLVLLSFVSGCGSGGETEGAAGAAAGSGAEVDGGASRATSERPVSTDSSAEPSVAGAATPGQEGAAAGGADGPGGGGPEPPEPRERNFQPRAFQFGEWYEDLTARVSPARDGWPTEVIAQVAERDVVRCLSAALAGNAEAWLEVLDEGFHGGSALRPDELEVRAADGTLTVSQGDPTSGVPVAGDDFVAAVRRLVEPLAGAVEPHVEAWATSAIELEGQRFECRMSIRVVALLGGGSRQLNLRWRTIWRLDPGRKRVMLVELAPERFEEAVYARVPFDELTQAVVADRQFFQRELHQGAIEYDGRYDRTVGSASVYLGMQGIAVGDVDGDGLEDIYVGEQGGLPNRLFMHQPDGTVRDRAREARVDYLDDTAGVLIYDLDGDGHRDLAMGIGQNVVLNYNDGTGSFPGRAVLRGPGKEQIYSLCAADADGDGDVDIYATRYVAGGVSRGLPTPYHDAENGASNLYWRNDGDRSYTLATDEVGLGVNNTRFSLSAIWEDFDRDGDLDLYVANDFGRNNLYRNDAGHFTDIADEVGAFDMAAGMGVTCADVELDGDIDFYVSNMFTAAGSRIAGHPGFQSSRSLEARGGYMHHTQGNSLLVSEGGTYRDITGNARSGPGGWAWGAMFMDFENDGLPDIVVPNGFLTNHRTEDLEGFFWRAVVNASPMSLPTTDEYKNAWVAISNLGQVDGYSWNGRELNYAYRNLGDGVFADVSGASGLDYRDDGRVAAVVDWDGDGRLDLWLKNRTAPTLRFLRNAHPTPGHWLSIALAGQGANSEAIGALVTVEVPAADGGGASRELAQRSYVGHGYLGSSSRRLHFGLDDDTGPVAVRVEWPDGSTARYEGLALDRTWRLAQGEPEAHPLPNPSEPLDALPARRLPERLPELADRWVDGGSAKVARVPLLDRLPLARMDLPTFDGDLQRAGELDADAVLLVLWGSWHERSIESLRTLARGLEGSDVLLYPLSMDAVRDEAYVLHVLEQLGLAGRGGRIDARLQLLFEMVIFEVLGPFEDHPLPFAFLLNSEGALSVMYVEEIDPAVVIEDGRLANVGLGLPESRWPVALTGGRWVDGRGTSRSLERLRTFLRKQGFRSIAAELKVEQTKRKDAGQ